MNILSEDNNSLSRLDYDPVLANILRHIQENRLFDWAENEQQIILQAHKIAQKVAMENIEYPLIAEYGTRSATINLAEQSERSFVQKIQQIYQVISKQLSETQLKLPSLVREQSDMCLEKQPSQLGFSYHFPGYSHLVQKRLRLQSSNKGSDSALKLHLLTVTVKNINSFTNELKQSISNHYADELMLDEQEKEDIEKELENQYKKPDSSFYKLRNLVFEETVGKLKKEAKILYLEYLKENIEDKNNLDLLYLKNLIKRLRILEQYINDLNKAESEYDVEYEGYKVNYKDIFSRAEALDRLPIIPIVEGNLGESSQIEKGAKEFIFCLKMKLNGTVNNQFDRTVSVLDYNLQILNPESAEHQEAINSNTGRETFIRKILQSFLLYYFVFAQIDDENFDPIAKYEQRCLATLQGNDQAKKRKLFKDLVKRFNDINIHAKVDKLKKLIQESLKRVAITEAKSWSIYLGLSRDILAPADEIIDGNSDSFFRANINKSKEYLKYITLTANNVDQNNLAHLPVKFTIEDMRYFPSEQEQSLSFNYNINEIKFLPVIFWNDAGKNDIISREYHKYFDKQKHISIPYINNILNGKQYVQSFLYKFTFSLLVYISLKTIITQLKLSEYSFIGILRLHKYGKDNSPADEEFIHHFSKTLDHLLSQDVLANSQGINIKDLNPYKVQNALSSFYTKLPKVFEFKQYTPKLDRLGIIVVSSREADRKTGEDTVLSNLIGEVITLDRQDNGIHLRNLRTFSANFEKSKMYQRPALLIDQVDDLYRRGYQHIFYVARTPYSSSLNLNLKDEDDFFMSKSVLDALKGDKSDLKIYPIFFDKYHVKNMKKISESTAYYVKESRELDKLVHDSSKQTVIFFNLFSGISVGGDQKFYNGVISYATLLNVYQGVLQEQDIRQALIHDDDNNQLKNDLLNYLTLVHYARYEARFKFNIKLDPYENIIGDQSVGAYSIFNHGCDNKFSINFNSLAFLTEVRNIVNANVN